jgi:hypothetical protein
MRKEERGGMGKGEGVKWRGGWKGERGGGRGKSVAIVAIVLSPLNPTPISVPPLGQSHPYLSPTLLV